MRRSMRCRRDAVGIRCGAISGNMKVFFRAGRSIGVCQPSTLHMLIWPEVISTQNRMAAELGPSQAAVNEIVEDGAPSLPALAAHAVRTDVVTLGWFIPRYPPPFLRLRPHIPAGVTRIGLWHRPLPKRRINTQTLAHLTLWESPCHRDLTRWSTRPFSPPGDHEACNAARDRSASTALGGRTTSGSFAKIIAIRFASSRVSTPAWRAAAGLSRN